MKSQEYLAFTVAQAGLDFAEHATSLLDATKDTLQLAEEASGTIDTIMEDIGKFREKAVDVRSVSLSGTLPGALGLVGENGRPLSAAVAGYLLGAPLTENVTFSPKDAVAFVKALFKQLWDILKFAPAPSLPASVSPTSVEFRTLLTSKGETKRFDSPVPSQNQHIASPAMLSTSGYNDEVTSVAPLIAVEHQAGLLPFAVARARFMVYRVKGTHEDTDQAKRRGLVILPAGPFTAGPPSNFSRPWA